MSLRGDDRIVIDDGGSGSKSGASKTNTANWKTKSEPKTVSKPTTQPAPTKSYNLPAPAPLQEKAAFETKQNPEAKSKPATANQPFRNPLALGGPNPSATMQRLNRITAAVEQTRAELVAAKRGERQTSYRPHGDNNAYHKAKRGVTTARNRVEALNKEIENITGVSGSERIGLTFGGVLTGMGASYVGAGGTLLKGADSGIRLVTDADIMSNRGQVAAQQYNARQTSYRPHGDNSDHHAARAETRRLQKELSDLVTAKEAEALAAEDKSALLQAAVSLDAEYERLRRQSEQDIARAKLGRPAAERFLIDTAVTGTQVAADAAANAVVPGSSLALKGVRSFGDASQEARRNGATVGQQIAYGTLTAGKDVAIEKLFDGLGGIYGKGAFNQVEKSPQIKEASEEALSTLIQPVLRSVYSGEVNYTPSVLDDALRNAAVKGTVSGAKSVWDDTWNQALDKTLDLAKSSQTQAVLRNGYAGPMQSNTEGYAALIKALYNAKGNA